MIEQHHCLEEARSRNNIVFLGSALTIPLRPYILTWFSQIQNEDNASKTADDNDVADKDPDDFPIHPYPSILALGTMLIEPYMGKTIECLAAEYGINEEENANTKYLVTYEVFRRCKAYLPVNYRCAFKKCLDPDFGSDPELKGEDFRQHTHSAIVKPLEDELDQGFGMTISLDELDSIAQTLDVGNWGQTMHNWPAESAVLSPAAFHSSPASGVLPPASHQISISSSATRPRASQTIQIDEKDK
jgi:hypothetical protein